MTINDWKIAGAYILITITGIFCILLVEYFNVPYKEWWSMSIAVIGSCVITVIGWIIRSAGVGR